MLIELLPVAARLPSAVVRRLKVSWQPKQVLALVVAPELPPEVEVLQPALRFGLLVAVQAQVARSGRAQGGAVGVLPAPRVWRAPKRRTDRAK